MPPKKKADQAESATKTAKPRRFYPNVVEVAPTAKTTCLACDTVIQKGEFRVTEADATRAYQFRGGEGESRGYGVFKSYAHLTCHEPPAWLYPLAATSFKFPKKLTPALKKAFDEWIENRNERGPGEEDYYMRNKKWLVLVDMEGGLVYSKTKLKTPRSLDAKSKKKSAADDDSDEEDERTKKSTKKTSVGKKRKRDEDDDEDEEEEVKPKQKKLKAKK